MQVEAIDSDELILRRIPPPLDENTKSRGDGYSRPISQRLQFLHKRDSGLSCSRLSQTTPRELLEQLRSQGKEPEGWGVCVIKVAQVRELGLDVIHKPERDDPGHCEIQGEFVRKTPKKLSAIARMLSETEVESGIVEVV